MLRMTIIPPALLLLATSGMVSADPLPDTLLTRVEVLASMETLHASILAGHSATKTLEAWCADHHWAIPPVVHAVRVAVPEEPVGVALRTALQIDATEPVKHRRVRLTCGSRTLSDADNWYVPSRLTPAMNRQLETTDMPFGKVVADLGYTRETLKADIVWSPLPAGWERDPPADRPRASLDIPAILFEHRALLSDKTHRPFSVVEEHYTRDVLDFSPRK